MKKPRQAWALGGAGELPVGAANMTIGQVKRRRKGIISLDSIDFSISAETSQPTIQGKPCRNCLSPVKYARRPGTCVRCHKQWRRDHERRSVYYRSKAIPISVKISPEQRIEMIEAQDWSCLICGEVASRLYLDHCHKTGKIRGMLCLHCNSGLGSFCDDPVRLSAAIEYLQTC